MSGGTDTAFDALQFSSIYPEGVERHYWNRCRNKVILDTVQPISNLGPLLEVGCGKGLVVSFLRNHGCDVRGVELADITPLPGMEPYVKTGCNALDLAIGDRVQVRTILLLDVIEHLEDPVSFLRQLRNGFPALRNLVITVPARQELFSNFDEFNGHFRRYDLALLSSQVELAGAHLNQAGYFFHALYPAARAQLRFAKRRSLRFNVPAKGLSSWLHAVLGHACYWDRKLLPASWKGSSIIARAEFRS
ncbi:MAG: methyltransferase domain-containing protein [Bacteroidetes bacterium]|nr:methyltransferase domain-containing protein [Bacteroidota bacterium]